MLERLRPPMLTLLSSAPDEVRFVLQQHLQALLRLSPGRSVFESDFRLFFVAEDDVAYVADLKIGLLSQLCTRANAGNICVELREYVEGADRKFGAYANSSCFLDLGTVQWTTFASDPSQFSNMPNPREYAGMTYDSRESRLVVFGGWNNGWLDDLYSLNVAKIVGPSYAITSSEPALGQLSGKSKLTIRGQGFKEPNIKVIFTNGNRPIDTFSGKTSKEVSAEFVSDTEITCLTPSFDDFGPNECVMQISIAGGDYTTTWVPF